MDDASRKIEVMESVYGQNERMAAEFNEKLTSRGIFCVNVLGAPGAGKTTALIRLINGLGRPAYVIEGDIESDIDAQKLKALGIPASQINTGGACHLDAPVVADAFAGDAFAGGYLFIENIGNLVCPAEFMIGEHVKILICSVTDGGDKPWKYPLAFEKAGLILLNKCDLLDYVDFDWEFFESGAKKLNPNAPIIKISSKTGAGIGEAVEWLRNSARNIIG